MGSNIRFSEYEYSSVENTACHFPPPPRVARARPEKEDEGGGKFALQRLIFSGRSPANDSGSLLRIFLPLVVPRRYSGRSVAIWPQCYPSPLPPPPPPPRSAFPISFRNGGGSRGGGGGGCHHIGGGRFAYSVTRERGCAMIAM